MLPRITEFVHNTFPIVADPKQITRKPFDIFGVYLIDKQGVLRTFLPGTKEARPRLDTILEELAKLEGVDAPKVINASGHALAETVRITARDLPAEDVINVAWMWSHSAVRPRDRFKLAFVTRVAPGYHVYAHDESQMSPFKIEFELPEGVSIVDEYGYPKSHTKADPFLKKDLAVFEGDIPMPVIYLRAANDIKPGTRIVKARIHYQSCNDSLCHPPTVKELEMPLPVVGPKDQRNQVAGATEW